MRLFDGRVNIQIINFKALDFLIANNRTSCRPKVKFEDKKTAN